LFCEYLSGSVLAFIKITIKKNEDTKEVIRRLKPNKNRQYNGQKKKDKQ